MQQPQHGQATDSAPDFHLSGQVHQSRDDNEQAHHQENSVSQLAERISSHSRQGHFGNLHVGQAADYKRSAWRQFLSDVSHDRLLILIAGIVIGMTIAIHTVETAISGLDLPQLCNTAPAATGN